MSGCTLRFAQDSPLRTTLVDEATGRAKYKIDTPRKVVRTITRIRKLDSSTQSPLHRDEDREPNLGDDVVGKGKKKSDSKGREDSEGDGDEVGTGEETELAETSDEMARIYWKWFSSHKIIFRGGITTRSKLLPKAGKMGGGCTLTGPDGVQYRWTTGVMGSRCPKLVTTDEKKGVIAKFHRAHHFTKKQKARLEVQPAGMYMLDYIILTLVFIEDERRGQAGM